MTTIIGPYFDTSLRPGDLAVVTVGAPDYTVPFYSSLKSFSNSEGEAIAAALPNGTMFTVLETATHTEGCVKILVATYVGMSAGAPIVGWCRFFPGEVKKLGPPK